MPTAFRGFAFALTVACVLFLASARGADPLKLEHLGITVTLPEGSAWKVIGKPAKIGTVVLRPTSDEMEAPSANGARLNVQLKLWHLYFSCAQWMKESSAIVGSTPLSGVDSLPPEWNPKLFKNENTAAGCLEVGKQVIIATITPAEPSPEDVSKIKALLQSVTDGYSAKLLAAAPPINLKILGITFPSPSGSLWEARTMELGPNGRPLKGGQPHDFISRSYPGNPKVFVLLRRNAQSPPCETAMAGASKAGLTRSTSAPWVPSAWNSQIVRMPDPTGVSMTACFDETPGTVTANISVGSADGSVQESDSATVRSLLEAATPALQEIQ